jgi:pimeloyl-ACP methyl ester carboxylesterase
MNTMSRRLAPLALAALLVGGCASAQPAAPSAGGEVVAAVLNIGGTDYSVDWFLPDAPAAALVTLQHGFARDCSRLRGTGQALMARGLMALCVNASMAGGNPRLAEALATTLLSGIVAPGGRELPQKIVVGGHSAGGLFASRVGWQLAASAPQRLAGALLFDPVDAGDALRANLMVVSATGERPVLAVTANASGCNAQANALPALRQLRQDAVGAGRDGFVGLQLTDRSTHVDAEGRDTDLLAVVACGQGAPRPANTATLRMLAAQWALDAAAGTREPAYYPGGAVVDALLGRARAALIE